MHRIAPSVVAWDEHDQIVAYAITMPQEARQLVPILQMLETLPIQGSWYVMGQVAVAPSQRGQGVFDALYHHHRDRYANRWDQIITEVATRNGRSMRAHQRVGFRTIKTFRDQTDEWAVIAWDWQAPTADSREPANSPDGTRPGEEFPTLD